LWSRGGSPELRRGKATAPAHLASPLGSAVSCEAWKWLAIGSGALALVGEEIYMGSVFGPVWPRDAERLAQVQARTRRYVPFWLLVSLVALVSLIVYLAHCVD
jgi:hypothetical protein